MKGIVLAEVREPRFTPYHTEVFQNKLRQSMTSQWFITQFRC